MHIQELHLQAKHNVWLEEVANLHSQIRNSTAGRNHRKEHRNFP